jgi:hypothetical protein
MLSSLYAGGQDSDVVPCGNRRNTSSPSGCPNRLEPAIGFPGKLVHGCNFVRRNELPCASSRDIGLFKMASGTWAFWSQISALAVRRLL